MDPHWMRIKKGTPLHTDPLYERYTHHLILKAEKHGLRGHDKVEAPLTRGTVYIMDVHSPHQVTYHDEDNPWYLSVSMDSDDILSWEECIPILCEYALSAEFIKTK
jgi:hypothetical protein